MGVRADLADVLPHVLDDHLVGGDGLHGEEPPLVDAAPPEPQSFLPELGEAGGWGDTHGRVTGGAPTETFHGDTPHGIGDTVWGAEAWPRRRHHGIEDTGTALGTWAWHEGHGRQTWHGGRDHGKRDNGDTEDTSVARRTDTEDTSMARGTRWRTQAWHEGHGEHGHDKKDREDTSVTRRT